MMRRTIAASIAAWLGACLLFGTLALAPDDAAAWTINQPRFEKQVVTEGDPDDPDFTYPGDASVNSMPEGTDPADVCTAVVQVVVVVLEAIGI